MDDELKKLLEENLELSKENNHLLKSVRGSQKRAAMMRTLYWILILGMTFGAYYYIQPYIEQMMSLYTGAQDNVKSLQDYFPESKNVQSIIEQFGGNKE
ncbi:MAG: hypothetical protein KBC42_01055 [Candidatus Pacebacteria bacterium]|nr:hypothetical protein [Candidatus Paceibacterota bacterium]MBP9780495.1 hypothetical protein [Candidatus Paceibacterota bacterium]